MVRDIWWDGRNEISICYRIIGAKDANFAGMELERIENVWFRDLGKMDYATAWDLQERILAANCEIKKMRASASSGHITDKNLETSHHLLFVEHPAVYTLGKSGKESNVLIGEEERKAKGIAYFRTNRGGDITFHGPGQVVGYPILDLEKFYTDIGRYLRNLEQVVIEVMADYGLQGERSEGETGVWLDPEVKGRERKICAIGVRCSRWITMHGFAFNVNTDLAHFQRIIPCGIQDKQVTSLQKELGREVPMEEVKMRIREKFCSVFNVRLQLPSSEMNESFKGLWE